MIAPAVSGLAALLGAMAFFAVLALALGCLALRDALRWFRAQRDRELRALEAMEANRRG